MADEPKGWHQRGYLPHFDSACCHQMITYRLADSVPQARLQSLQSQLADKKINDKDYRTKLELWIDKGLGACALQKREIAEVVMENWKYWDGQRYQLLNWVIMPNHVHLLIKQLDNCSLSTIVKSWKSYTATIINRMLTQSGQFWAPDYWDRFIRDEQHFLNAWNYIDQNPVKARLVDSADLWTNSRIGWGNNDNAWRPISK